MKKHNLKKYINTLIKSKNVKNCGIDFFNKP